MRISQRSNLVGPFAASRSTWTPMASRATQEPLRPVTRSTASTMIRRSARLQNGSEKHPSSLRPSFSPGPTRPNMHRGTRKRVRSPSASSAPRRRSRSRKGCRQVNAQVEPGARSVRSRESTVPGEGPSVHTIRISACHRGSSRVKELEEQLDVALQAKQELVAEINEYKVNAAQSNLKHLEDFYTCPLCFEIMACPYALIPRECGHTFCATCILKWFFSRLHNGCGGWHEAVECPLCRNALPHTPERTPRSTHCFPFIPNRTVDVAIRDLINAISHELAGASSALASDPLSDWNENGRGKREWSKRERAGRVDISSIAAQWNTMEPTDFVSIKNRLEV